MKQELRNSRRGVTMIYALVIMTAMCMFMSLAVDYGHAQLVKTELRRTADASARAAAQYIYTDHSAGIAAALDVASRNTADGKPVVLNATQDIQYGFWNVNTKTFTYPASASSINAVRVVAVHNAARGNAVPMMFASVLGRNTCDVQAETIFMAVAATNVNQNVMATADPFLSGMPAGSTASEINPANDPDYAGDANNPKESPQAVNLPISGGSAITFDSLTGDAAHNPTLTSNDPDGDIGDPNDPIGHNNLTTTYSNNYSSTMYSENGIADAWIPINAIVGVFLDDKQPNMSPTPATSDFSTAASRDFDTLQPQLKQIFFIGDGLNSKGNHQQFIAPKGATHLYLAMMDYYEWSNNVGSRTMKINRPGQIIMVK